MIWPHRPGRPHKQREGWYVALTAAVSLAAAIWALRLWQWQPDTPFDLKWDAVPLSAALKDVSQHGWYWFNSDLGYPFGQNGSLFPELNVLHLAIVKAFDLVIPGTYTSGVVYFVLGFPLAAVAAHLLARQQGITPPAATVVGVLFSLAPGHQEKFGHLWLSSYWVIPMGIWITLEILAGRPLAPARAGVEGWRRRLTPRLALVAVSLVCVGLSGVYYAAFILTMIAVATIARRLRAGTANVWASGVGSIAAISLTILVPLVIARLGASRSVLVGSPPTTRSFAESEIFAGKLMDLILPWPGHRVDAFAHLTWAYNAVTTSTMEVVALGLIGTAGCLLLALTVMRTLAGRPASERMRHWSLLGGTAFMFYIVGGLGSFTALFFVTEVRTWSRLSIIILLMALLAVGHALSRLASEGRRRSLAIGLAGSLVVLGVLDQTNPAKAPDYQANAAQFADLTAYTSQLESATGGGCAVFQLPVTPFPESAGTHDMGGYDQILPYLASHDLEWSFGGMRDTAESEWQRAVPLTDTPRLVADLAATGFCALEVNTRGFDESTDPRGAIEDALGVPVAKTSDGAFVAYRIPATLARNGSRDRLLQPVTVTLNAYQMERVAETVGQWVGPTVSLRVTNLGQEPIPVSVSFAVRTGVTERHVVTSDPTGRILAEAKVPAMTTKVLKFDLLAKPGSALLPLTLSGDPERVEEGGVMASAFVSELKVWSDSPVTVASIQQQVQDGAVSMG
jgi:hypothetical protein